MLTCVMMMMGTAVQCVPLRLRRHGRAVCPHGQPADPDESGEQDGV